MEKNMKIEDIYEIISGKLMELLENQPNEVTSCQNKLDIALKELQSTYEAHIGNDDGTGAKWPQKIYFNYKKNSDKAYKEIDQSSITWYETPADTKAYEANKDSFGKIDTKQKDTNLPSISSGLNTPVKNRYLLPLYSRTISTSNGTLKNSYGYN